MVPSGRPMVRAAARQIHLMKIEQDDGFAIAEGQGQHGAAHHFVVLLLDRAFVLSCRDGGLGGFVERQGDGGEALELGAEDIGCQSEEPGGEAGLATPLGETAPGANEGLLGHLFGAATVAAVAPGHVDERPLPAADDAFEGLRRRRRGRG